MLILLSIFIIIIKLKSKFAEVYGVKISELTFEFDGEALEDTDTVAEREIENDDLIDVKVRR